MRDVLLIALCGAAGAVCRYGVGISATRLFGPTFPYGTLLVNVAGCFLIGLLMQLSTVTSWIPPPTRSALVVGFLGAFTTFSAFGYQTLHLAQHYEYRAAGINVVANVVLSLAAVWLGVTIARAAGGT